METKKGYGSFGVRFLAYVFDSLLFWLVPLLLLFLLVVTVKDTVAFWTGLLWIVWEIIFINWLIRIVYFIGTYCYFGASLGKLLAGLRIEREDGMKPTIKNGLMRFIVGYSVSALLWGVGFLWIIRDAKGKGFHDHIAETVVIVKNKAWELYLAFPFLIAIIIFLLYSINHVGTDRGLWVSVGADISWFLTHLQTIFSGK